MDLEDGGEGAGSGEQMADVHRLLLQYFIGCRIEKEDVVRNKFQAICEHFQVREELDLDAAVATINHNLHFLWLEVRRVVDELTGAAWYGIANMRADDAAKLATSYSDREVDYLKKLIEGIMESNSGALTAAQLANAVPGGMTKSEAQESVESLLADHWLCEPKTGLVSLGVRTLLELRSYIEDTFSDQISECVFCHELVILGESCPNSKCSTRAHFHCLRRWKEGKGRSKGVLKCPSCTADWTPGKGASGPARKQAEQQADQEEEVEPEGEEEEGFEEDEDTEN